MNTQELNRVGSRKPDIWRGFVNKGMSRIKSIERIDLVNKKLREDLTDPNAVPTFRFIVKIKGFTALHHSYTSPSFRDVAVLFTDADFVRWVVRDPEKVMDKRG